MLLGTLFRSLLVGTVLFEFGAAARAQTPRQPDPWTAGQLLGAKELSAILSGAAPKPAVIYAGFPVLYRGAHITGAVLAGPASKPEGQDELKNLVRDWPRDRPIVLYCGCCPFQQCPNIRPAFRALQEMGFDHLKVLILEKNLHADWVAKGYPTTKGDKP